MATLSRWLLRGGSVAWADNELLPALAETLGLALIGAIITTMAAFPAAWLSVRRPGPLSRLIEAASFFVGAVPAVITGLSLVAFTVHTVRPLYQSAVTLLLAYGIMFLPRAIVGLRASLSSIPKGLEEVAGSLGRTPLQTLLEITMRLVAPGTASAMALVGLGITNELTATLMPAPNGTRTLATQFWSYTVELDYIAAAPYAILMVMFSALMVLLLQTRTTEAAES
jgi:iron(III) transport system permease protein